MIYLIIRKIYLDPTSYSGSRKKFSGIRKMIGRTVYYIEFGAKVFNSTHLRCKETEPGI
jgi:hypothetical protein